MRLLLSLVLATLVLNSLARAQQSGAAKASTSPNAPISGKSLYEAHCAVCHGEDAKGGGPFAPQLKVWPPDLTTLAKRNNGTFPRLHVSEAIDGEFDKSAHGSKEMPIWGPVFRSMAHGHADNVQLRIRNLVKYIESVQEH